MSRRKTSTVLMIRVLTEDGKSALTTHIVAPKTVPAALRRRLAKAGLGLLKQHTREEAHFEANMLRLVHSVGRDVMKRLVCYENEHVTVLVHRQGHEPEPVLESPAGCALDVIPVPRQDDS